MRKTFSELANLVLVFVLCVSVLIGMRACEEQDEDINTPIEEFYGH